MNIDIALQALIAILTRASEISALITQARAEGRDVSAAELDALAAADDAARDALADAIAKARDAG